MSGNAVLQMRGARRIAGVGIGLTFFSMLGMALKSMMGISDEEERALRETLDDWEQGQAILLLGKSPEGVFRYANVSYLNFYSYVTDPIMHLLSGAFSDREDELHTSMGEGVLKAFFAVINPITGEQSVTKSVAEAMVGFDERGFEIGSPTGSVFDNSMAKLQHVVMRSLMPGTVKDLSKITQIGSTTASGEVITPLDIGLHMSGQRIRSWDPKIALQRRYRQLSNAAMSSQSNLNRVLTSRGSVTAAEINEAYAKANEDRAKLGREARRLAHAGEILGLDRRAMKDVYREGGISNAYQNMIRTNRVENVEVAKETLRSARSRSEHITKNGGIDADRLTALRDAIAQHRKQEFLDE